MPFHLEGRDGEDQPGSMDRISFFFKKIIILASRKITEMYDSVKIPRLICW